MSGEQLAETLARQAHQAAGHDWPRAAALAAELRGRFPDHPAGYQIGSAAARELRRFDDAALLLTDATARFPRQAWPLVEAAWTARARGDLDQAARLAAELRERFETLPAGYQMGAAAARQLGRLDEAAAILAEGAARFPTHPWALAEAALTARARGETEAATRLAAELRDRFPADPNGYHIGSATARDRQDFDAAVAILAEAAQRFPAAPWPVVEAAWIARARGDAVAAIRLATELRDRFADLAAGYQIGAAAAREALRFDDAAAILAAAMARFPDESWPLDGAAKTEAARGDIAAALRLAAEQRRRFPDEPEGYQTGATLLRRAGQLDEAEALMRAAAARFPTEAWPAREAAALARLRADRTEAAHLATALRGAAPALIAAATWPARERVVVVVGMHRAGTSLCTRIVQHLGVALGGPLMPPAADNPDGYQELVPIVDCHEMLLDALGARWDTLHLLQPVPPSFWRGEPAAAARGRLKRIVAEQVAAAGGAWAFKDPRTARFLPLWRQVFEELGIQPVWLLSVRDPRAIAASLLARDGIPAPVGALLWVEHYLDALRHLGPDIAGIVHYEHWFTAPESQVARLAGLLGDAPAEAVEAARGAIRADLRHNAPAGDAPDAQPDGASDLARHLHAWLLAAPPDLARLQRQAARLWPAITALACSRPPERAPPP